MHIHFSQDLKFSDIKKELISKLVCERINLLIGIRKASFIENVFFVEKLPYHEPTPHEIRYIDDLHHCICLYTNSKNADLYCTHKTLYSLISQATEIPSFDDAMLMVSKNLPVISSSQTRLTFEDM